MNKIMSVMAKGIFITGTDTGVGKTAITTALLALLRARGVDAVPMKPIQTGCFKRGGAVVAPEQLRTQIARRFDLLKGKRETRLAKKRAVPPM